MQPDTSPHQGQLSTFEYGFLRSPPFPCVTIAQPRHFLNRLLAPSSKVILIYSLDMHIDHDTVVLQNEADVEMKIIVPLLQGAAYLDIPQKSIKPKGYLAPTPFNRKAGLTSGGFPDFSVWLHSFPCLIVEAKSPEVAVEIGYHEARIYAGYLNQNYPTGINPAHFIFATNGIDFLAGCRDCTPIVRGKVSDLRPQSQIMVKLQQFCGRQLLEDHA